MRERRRSREKAHTTPPIGTKVRREVEDVWRREIVCFVEIYDFSDLDGRLRYMHGD